MNKYILAIILTIILALSIQPIVLCNYTGLDDENDVPDLNNFNTGNQITDGIINFFLGTLSNFGEILYDAFLKVPFSVLANSWLVVYNSLLYWGLGSPTAWAIATILFITVFGVGIAIFFKIIDYLG